MNIIENKDIFQIVFDSAANGIGVMRPVYNDEGKVEDFSILLLNKFILNWIGDMDYKGKRYKEVFLAFEETGMLKIFIHAFESGVTKTFEHAGIDHWFQYTAVKQAELVIVTIENVTERKKAEVALNDSLDKAEKQQRLYNSITNNTPDLVYVFDLTYRFTYANKALLAMWGKSEEDAIGRGLRENGYEEWHAAMHEREINEIVATKKSFRGTVSFPHAEFGSRIYDYILVPVFNEKGEVEAIAGTTRDITDIKRAEEHLKQSDARLKSMINQTPAPTLVLMGDELIIEQANKSMLNIIGRGEEIIGIPLISIMPELQEQYIWKQAQKVYKEGTTFDQSEVLVPHKRNGKMQDYYYNIAYRPLKEDGQITGMIQVAIDVTEQVVARKRIEENERRYKALSETLEEQVNERTKELQRSNEDLQQFAHVASHDLKEPVRKIKTFTSRLEDQLTNKLDEPSTRFIEKIQTAAERMSTMIDGVLAYSTINAGKQKTALVDLNDVLKNIETDLEIPLQKTGVVIQYHDLPTIEGAPFLLYQLFYNLINNSIKFAKVDIPPQIKISSVMHVEQNANLACITVEDNGIGFEPDFAIQIFETFTRLNSKDKYEGTGLGLSLCKKIVERHGGIILANGSKDKGATFRIILPLQQKTDV